MKLSGKRLLILGGSQISCEIVKHARAMGVTTGVADWYPVETSPAKLESDEAYVINTSDIDAMVNLIKQKKFDGVLTGFTDSVLPYYADMCDKAGLPSYASKELLELFTDKEKYKALMREFDVPTIPEYSIDVNRLDETTKNIAYPVIVKPSDGSGSRGITVCYDQEELKKAIEFASDSSKSKDILVEPYIEAAEATVFWLFVNGKCYLSLLGNRHIKHNQEGELALPVGYTYPSAVQPKFLAETAPKMEKMFGSVGIKNGMMFMQCKIVDGSCIVYDIGYRLTGSLEYINLRRICGYDPMDMLICFALTGDMGELDIEKKVDPYLGGKYAYNVSLLCKPGKVFDIKGLDEIRKLPGVLDVVIAHPVGDVITEDMKGRLAQITVRVLGRADSVEEMKSEMLRIQHLAHVVSDTGEEMILPGMEESDYVGSVYER